MLIFPQCNRPNKSDGSDKRFQGKVGWLGDLVQVFGPA